jgi:hypothetical protein
LYSYGAYTNAAVANTIWANANVQRYEMVLIKRFDTAIKISGSYGGHCPIIGWRNVAVTLNDQRSKRAMAVPERTR